MACWGIKAGEGVGVRLCSSPEIAGKRSRTLISELLIPRSQAWVFSKKRGGKILHFGKISNSSGKYISITHQPYFTH